MATGPQLRLLAGPRTPEPFADHVARLGRVPYERGGRNLGDDIAAAGLRGRGGAGFPAGRKWAAVAAHRGQPVVVANGNEGEPASWKDRTLMRLRPHLVIDGLLVTAHSLDSREAYIAVPDAFTDELRSVRAAVDERADEIEALNLEVRVVEVPHRYVSGERSAVVNFINAGTALPRFSPPRTSDAGVHGSPTLVHNVETLADIALIARRGPQWFRDAGTEASPGTVLLTVLGGVAHSGVIEMGTGATLDDVIAACGGPRGRTRAALVGGYFGSWFAGAKLERVRIDYDVMREIGGSLGCGVVAILNEEHCGVEEMTSVFEYLARESSGQCGPCLHGLAAIATKMRTLASAGGTPEEISQIRRWMAMVRTRGACNMPDGAVMMLNSGLRAFERDLVMHCAGRLCEPARAGRHLLPTPVHEAAA